MRHEIINADVLDGLRSLPDTCVQCVVTSPPYWSLRDYQVEGQIGLEPTPEDHVEKIVEVFREVRRVLRDDGVVFLNYGDSYYAGSCGRPDTPPSNPFGLKPKDLVGMPWRIALALQADGWYLRSDCIWSKPNSMPESVTDRPMKSHEYVFLLAKQGRYFYDCDAVREITGRETSWKEWEKAEGRHAPSGNLSEGVNCGFGSKKDSFTHPSGRNRRTVWEIATQPTSEAHFATFPEALVEPCIKAGTSERGCCPTCGAPWKRSVEKEFLSPPSYIKTDEDPLIRGSRKISRMGDGVRVTTTGWHPSCICGCEDTVPCVVLDPFGGSGTVTKVARDLGRSSIYIELSPEYVQIAKKRLRVGEQLDTRVCEYVVREVIS